MAPPRVKRPRSVGAVALDRWIASAGMSAREVADMIGVSPQALSHYRCGYSQPNEDIARSIASITADGVPSTVWERKRRC